MVAARAALLVGLVGLRLVLQDLRDEAVVGFGGDEDVGQHQGSCHHRDFRLVKLSR